MIPILLMTGIVIGLLPGRLPIPGVLVAAIIWTVLFARDDLLTGPLDTAFVFAWGIVNLAAGAFIAWLIKRLISTSTSE